MGTSPQDRRASINLDLGGSSVLPSPGVRAEAQGDHLAHSVPWPPAAGHPAPLPPPWAFLPGHLATRPLPLRTPAPGRRPVFLPHWAGSSAWVGNLLLSGCAASENDWTTSASRVQSLSLIHI